MKHPKANDNSEDPIRTSRFRTFDSLSVPEYRWYFLAMFLYFGAMQMTVLARPWLAFELSAGDDGSRSALALGITIAGNNLPSLLLAPYAGVLADRVSKRNILIVAALLMTGFALTTAAGVVAGVYTWWHIALIGVGQGMVMTVITPSRRAIIPELVPSSKLFNATSLHTMTNNTNRTLMPVVAGFAIAGAGAESAYILIAGLYMASIGDLEAVPKTPAGSVRTERSIQGALREGFSYAAKEPVIRSLLLLGIAGGVLGQLFQHLLPLFQPVLDIGPAEVGVLFTLMGVGSLIGSTTSASLGDFRRKGLLLVGFFTLLGVAVVDFAASDIYVLSLILMIPVGFGQSGRTAVHVATLQTYTEPAMRGRVNAINSMQSGLLPVAALAITAISGVVGPQWAVGGAGAVIIAYGLWELLFSRTVRDLH